MVTDVGDTAVSFVAIFKEQSGVHAVYFRELPEEARAKKSRQLLEQLKEQKILS